MSEQPVTEIRVTLTVQLNANGVPLSDIVHNVEEGIRNAIGNGLITQSSDAEVESWTITSTHLMADASEIDIADLMLARIESGDLAVEDIPLRLARYGLMDPVAFQNEMQERIENSKLDSAE